MIVRIVRGSLTPGRIVDARRALWAAGLLRGEWRPGVVRPHAWVRADEDVAELVWLDFWATSGAAAAGSGPSNGPQAAALLASVLDDQAIAHFEVEEGLTRESADEPRILRLAVGRFSRPGADVETQEILRRRLPSLGPEMVEAYVGRRIVGRAVEVAFISTWLAEPVDGPLDAPLWPDVVVRYDSVHIGRYRRLSE